MLSPGYFGPLPKYRIEITDHGVLEVDVDAWCGGAALARGAEVGLDRKDEAAVPLEQ